MEREDRFRAAVSSLLSIIGVIEIIVENIAPPTLQLPPILVAGVIPLT